MPQDRFRACIEACYACAAACDHCSSACLQEDDVKMMARCIALDMDCAQLCRTAAAFMARGSDSAHDLCRLCADVCAACADECGKHDMDHCQACAAACRRCAEECRRMAGAA
ncbi:four-helix bundle copper-binding protein [Massilia forsythiae]|uniref:Four-helix bundle copper-binding protein n=1 Tax=Massilia forsythiae TaxID=2728020 RepID=A0A7Z2W0R1_9BURK|nr:four-helix bundle copper-binding protein [Massilia forsythiae]QJE02300.1 four-helix bundle copper-binding protein [Massilia forsythiae]